MYGPATAPPVQPARPTRYGVYARLFHRVVGEALSSARRGTDQLRGTAEGWERRALLVPLGDVLAPIACVSHCAEHHNTVGEAAAQEKSLPSFPMLRQVDAEMTSAGFVKGAARAFFMWPTLLLKEQLNQRAIAHLVRHALFFGNGPGWDAWMRDLRAARSWFGAGIQHFVPEPSRELESGV